VLKNERTPVKALSDNYAPRKLRGKHTVGAWSCSSVCPTLEDTKAVIRIRRLKDRQHNGQKKKDKWTNNDLKNIHIKLKIE
jgi:hypothetical protein